MQTKQKTITADQFIEMLKSRSNLNTINISETLIVSGTVIISSQKFTATEFKRIAFENITFLDDVWIQNFARTNFCVVIVNCNFLKSLYFENLEGSTIRINEIDVKEYLTFHNCKFNLVQIDSAVIIKELNISGLTLKVRLEICNSTFASLLIYSQSGDCGIISPIVLTDHFDVVIALRLVNIPVVAGNEVIKKISSIFV